MGLNVDLNDELCVCAKGPRNLITDVPGVRVGHVTLEGDSPAGPLHTGVTAIVPPGDCFTDKLPAAAYVSNGFGKSMGLVQVEELGSLETPILMTNTLSCGACFDALVRYSLDRHTEIGVETGTVNPVIMECNDGPINTIRAMAVTADHGLEAIDAATGDFAEGVVGAGAGMTCFGLKGGIGSASRVLTFDGRDFTVGVLVLTNFGSLPCLRIGGRAIGRELARVGLPEDVPGEKPVGDVPDMTGIPDTTRAADVTRAADAPDKGSIVAVIATDLPVDSRQLKRMAKRVTVGIARCGGYIGNGSGEIVVAFSTANRIPHWAGEMHVGEANSSEKGGALPMIDRVERLSDNAMDACFRAVASASEEAIVSSLWHAHSVVGRDGRTTWSLRDAASHAGIPLESIS
ncbi:P1 family peptidase [Bifidobacterium sp. UTBIF-78]|uniref:DmpA family aminopeptidase n=1 Tax=Bifidobacterium sp. UTBIF-78 TaxID=1465263 RepID=UPI00112E85C7|nr:P1 family peptidase [Bifidobacterium sp. UTBIF-78]TPF95113.1 D-aminopeptidase [Bifidobacterium sp. UTBIF-78]